jgi:hypothetical protein
MILGRGFESPMTTKLNICFCYLFVLVGRNCDEFGLLEDVGPEGGVGQLHDVVGPHQVESRLVLVHRVQDGL